MFGVELVLAGRRHLVIWPEMLREVFMGFTWGVTVGLGEEEGCVFDMCLKFWGRPRSKEPSKSMRMKIMSLGFYWYLCKILVLGKDALVNLYANSPALCSCEAYFFSIPQFGYYAFSTVRDSLTLIYHSLEENRKWKVFRREQMILQMKNWDLVLSDFWIQGYFILVLFFCPILS